jgi:hypothetical protein
VKLSAESVVPEGLLCDRRRRAGKDGMEVVDAERGTEPSESAVGDAGSIVREGTLSAACCGVARRGPDLGFAEGSTTGGDRVSGEEEFLLGVVECEGWGDMTDGRVGLTGGGGGGVVMAASVVALFSEEL